MLLLGAGSGGNVGHRRRWGVTWRLVAAGDDNVPRCLVEEWQGATAPGERPP